MPKCHPQGWRFSRTDAFMGSRDGTCHTSNGTMNSPVICRRRLCSAGFKDDHNERADFMSEFAQDAVSVA